MLMNEQLLKCPSVEWNGVPNHVVCVFPYVVSVTTDAIEIRSVVNGALLQTTCWPEMTLISSKVSESDLLTFCSVAPTVFGTETSR